MTLLHNLAPHVGGRVIEGRVLWTEAGTIQCSFNGKVRLFRHGQVTVPLGSLVDGVEALARSYEAAVGGGQVAS